MSEAKEAKVKGNERISSLYLEATKRFTNKEIDALLPVYNQKISQLKLDTFTAIKKNCEEYKWFREHGSIEFNEKTGYIRITNTEKSKSEENKKKLLDFNECAKLISLKQNQLFDKISEKNKEIIKDYSNCLKTCEQLIDTTTDELGIKCFGGCIEALDQENAKKFEYVDKKLEEISKRL